MVWTNLTVFTLKFSLCFCQSPHTSFHRSYIIFFPKDKVTRKAYIKACKHNANCDGTKVSFFCQIFPIVISKTHKILRKLISTMCDQFKFQSPTEMPGLKLPGNLKKWCQT